MDWPPALEQLKADLAQPAQVGDRDDDALRLVLDAAVALVERVRSDINYTGDILDERPGPDGDLVLGTLRLAGRWHTRRNSPDGLVSMGEMGSSRVPSFDPDIERLLRVGRFRKSVIA